MTWLLMDWKLFYLNSPEGNLDEIVIWNSHDGLRLLKNSLATNDDFWARVPLPK